MSKNMIKGCKKSISFALSVMILSSAISPSIVNAGYLDKNTVVTKSIAYIKNLVQKVAFVFGVEPVKVEVGKLEQARSFIAKCAGKMIALSVATGKFALDATKYTGKVAFKTVKFTGETAWAITKFTGKTAFFGTKMLVVDPVVGATKFVVVTTYNGTKFVVKSFVENYMKTLAGASAYVTIAGVVFAVIYFGFKPAKKPSGGQPGGQPGAQSNENAEATENNSSANENNNTKGGWR